MDSGAVVSYDRGQLGDAETMIRFVDARLSCCVFFCSNVGPFVISLGEIQLTQHSSIASRYFRVSEDDNPDNFVRLMLPGAQGERDDLSSFFFRKWKSTMEDWRRQMHYPPKQSDLWRMAKELNLFGYEDDEDEEKFLRASDNPNNEKILNALPMSTDEATVEEQMMLMGCVGCSVPGHSL